LIECLEVIKKNQIKRNQKSAKIISIKSTLDEMIDKNIEEDNDELKKLREHFLALEDEIKDTEFIQDEIREGEEMTLSRAIQNLIITLKFLKLLCENHNL